MMRSLAFICCLLLSGMCSAQSTGNMSYQDATNLGTSVGTALNPVVKQRITTGEGQNTVPGYGTDPDQKKYFNGGVANPTEPGANRVAGCVNKDDVECQAVNLLKDGKQTRPQFDLKNDPLIARAKALNKNPTAITGDIFSTYESCVKSVREIAPVFETQICNEFATNEDKTCSMGVNVVVDPDYIYKCLETIQSQANATCTVGRVINVDTKYNYQCDQSPVKIDQYTCNKTLVVTCEPVQDGCDNGGIVPGTTQGDMRVWFGPSGNGDYTLEFGTFADNYWGGWGAIYDRTLKFNIANPSGVTRFALINASFDDWIAVRVNGTLVYVGPWGGDRLEVVNSWQTFYEGPGRRCQQGSYDNYWSCYTPQDYNAVDWKYYTTCSQTGDTTWTCQRGDPNNGKVQYCATCFHGPELATNWNQNIWVDLRPYLVSGENTIWMRTIVADVGEGAIRISARMACPQNCYDNWDNQCAWLEQKL